ncbi:putative Ig domain-containing protein [Cohnella sp. GbtcB17]|uniref:putative Ig domain-containing protein n=1 Tax=Cohnella sp. GbtcB17 TaxID=2824762 RepID=UPI001C30E8FB|nr:putative Ig domain-containing protein [Cohnella sp. GbtcB17]
MHSIRRKIPYRYLMAWLLIVMMTSAPVQATAFAEKSEGSKGGSPAAADAVLDTVSFGLAASERAHKLKESNTAAGIDDRKEPETTGADGLLTGGGLGERLPYRYIRPSETETIGGWLEFTLKADPYAQNYLTVQLNGTQQGRGDLYLKGPGGDTSILRPANGTVYPELDNGYEPGAPFLGRYYYATYLIPNELVDLKTKTITLQLSSIGVYDAYGTGKNVKQTQNSKFIYGASTHTDPFYPVAKNAPDGTVPSGKPTVSDKDGYETVVNQAMTVLKEVLSWQLYGDTFDRISGGDHTNNGFLEGAIVTRLNKNEPAHPEYTKQQWASKYLAQAVNFQNWSPMMGVEIFANAYLNEWSGEYYHNPEMLDRIFKLLDFYARAQDSTGGWCVPTSGSVAYTWIGADLNGSGKRGKGERWPLLSNGTDSMLAGFVKLYNGIASGSDEQAKKLLGDYLEEKVDNDMTGDKSVTRRMSYIEMFGMLQKYFDASSAGKDFYDPASRAGTANQDVGFPYATNRSLQLLVKSMDASAIDVPGIMETPRYKPFAPEYDDRIYDMIKYKLGGEMVDGEKWMSENAQILEAGASHGGYAGDYGPRMLLWFESYAELTEGDAKVHGLIVDLAKRSLKAFAPYMNELVAADGTNVLVTENTASARKNTYGLHAAYLMLPYLALEAGSEEALNWGMKYVEDGRVFALDAIHENLETTTPHIYTNLIDLEQAARSYKTFAAELAKRVKSCKSCVAFPMEDAHKDFVFADLDSQSVVFKHNGEKVYVTFNWRRDNWAYTDQARIHYTTATVDRIANVAASHQGGVFTFTDSTANYRHDGAAGAAFTHTRYDGLNQTRYGKYVIGMNLSRHDAAVGQQGTVYRLEVPGVSKAKDLISGKTYSSKEGELLTVPVQPRQTVILEALKESDNPAAVKIVRATDDKVISFETVYAKIGQNYTAKADSIEGYKLEDKADKKIKVNRDASRNVILFRYSENAAPVFHASVLDTYRDWEVANLAGAAGEVRFDERGSPAEIATTGVAGRDDALTFIYRKLIGDGSVTMKVDGFDRTADPKTYASVMMMQQLDYNAPNVQFRLFSNGDGVLLTHRSEADNTQKASWTLDQNKNAAPIYIRLERKGNIFFTSFSKDGKNWTYATKSSYELDTGSVMYVGLSLTDNDDYNGSNTVHVSQVDFQGKTVITGKVGETIELDLMAEDREQDPIEYKTSGLPEGATLDEASRLLTWTPQQAGLYTIKALAFDPYHRIPVENTIVLEIGDAGLSSAN